MRRRIWFVGILVLSALGVAAPVRAGTLVAVRDYGYVKVAGTEYVNGGGDTTQTCDTKAVEPLLCAALLAITPVHVHLGSGDNEVIVSLDGHAEPYTP